MVMVVVVPVLMFMLMLVLMLVTFAMVTRVMVMFMFFFSHNLSGFTSAKVQPLSCNPVANLAAHLGAVKNGQNCGPRCHFEPLRRQNRPKLPAPVSLRTSAPSKSAENDGAEERNVGKNRILGV